MSTSTFSPRHSNSQTAGGTWSTLTAVRWSNPGVAGPPDDITWPAFRSIGARRLGACTYAISGTVMALVLTSQTMPLPDGGGQVPTKNAFLLCFATGAAAAILGAILTLCIPDSRRWNPHKPVGGRAHWTARA